MGKGNSPKVDEAHGFLYLGHSNWTIFNLLTLFCDKKLPSFCPASHNKPFIINPERGRKQQGQNIGKGNMLQVVQF